MSGEKNKGMLQMFNKNLVMPLPKNTIYIILNLLFYYVSKAGLKANTDSTESECKTHAVI